MSFDIFLQRFQRGKAAAGDGQAIMAVLNPLVEYRDVAWARIVLDDGEADVYGIDEPETGLMINHAAGRHVWDVIFAIARAGGMLVMPVGCPTCVLSADQANDVPDGAPDAVVVRSGAEILRVVETA